eukprot:3424148-Rhodomonas_salina.1
MTRERGGDSGRRRRGSRRESTPHLVVTYPVSVHSQNWGKESSSGGMWQGGLRSPHLQFGERELRWGKESSSGGKRTEVGERERKWGNVTVRIADCPPSVCSSPLPLPVLLPPLSPASFGPRYLLKPTQH